MFFFINIQLIDLIVADIYIVISFPHVRVFFLPKPLFCPTPVLVSLFIGSYVLPNCMQAPQDWHLSRILNWTTAKVLGWSSNDAATSTHRCYRGSWCSLLQQPLIHPVSLAPHSLMFRFALLSAVSSRGRSTLVSRERGRDAARCITSSYFSADYSRWAC